MSATLQNGVFFIRSPIHGKVLHVPTPRGGVICSSLNRTPSELRKQLFTISPIPGLSGYYTITNVATGTVLDIDHGSKGQANVLAWTNNGRNNQKWTFASAGETRYIIINHMTGTVLDLTMSYTTDGTAIIGFPLHRGINQQWEFVAAEENMVVRSISTPAPAVQVVEKIVEKIVPGPERIVEKEKIVEKVVDNPKLLKELDTLRGQFFRAMKGWEECRGA